MHPSLRPLASLRLSILAICLAAGAALQAQMDVPVPNFISHYGDLTGVDAAYSGPAEFKFALVTKTAPVTAYWKNDNNGLAAFGQSPVTEPVQAITSQVTLGNFGVFLGNNNPNNFPIPYLTFTHPGLRVRAWYRKSGVGAFTQLPDVDLPAAGYAMQIPDNTVTGAKMVSNSVSSLQLANGAVTPGKLAPAAVTASSIAAGAISASALSTPAAPASGQTLSFNGTSLVWAGTGGSPWLANGSGQPYTLGAVGIGTNMPLAKLDVRGGLVLDPGSSPILYTGTGNAELNRYLTLLNSPNSPTVSGIKAGGLLVANDYSYANPGKNDLIVKGNFGLGTAAPQGKLDVRGRLVIDNGGNVEFFTGTGNVELNRYVTLLNSTTAPNASGLKAGGILVSDSFFYADPGKNDLIVKGNIAIGTASPLGKLDVRGRLVIDNGGNCEFFTGTASTELNRYVTLLNSPALPNASGLKAGGILVADSFFYANPGKNDLIVKGKVSIGTLPAPFVSLSVAKTPGNGGPFDLDAAIVGTGSSYSGGVAGRSATGYAVNGFSDSGTGVFAGTNSGKALFASGNVQQSRDKGGFVKAMVFIRGDAAIIRGFNSLLDGAAANTAPCGFSVQKFSTFSPIYVIDFGFKVDDRFVNILTANAQVVGIRYGVSVLGTNPNVVEVTTSSSTDMTVFVY